MYYIYVVNNKNKLKGVISLRDIIVGDPKDSLENIMHKQFPYIYDKDDIHDLIKIISKYNLMAIAVIDNEKDLLGNVIINDIVYEILKKNKKIG